MERKIRILAIALGVQILLAFCLFWVKGTLGTPKANETLSDLKIEDADKIVIQESKKPELKLQRKADAWVIPESFGFPINVSKIYTLQNNLLEAPKAWPVGKTESAFRRFKVSEESYIKKITFFKEDKVLKTFYLGSPAGFRKAYARIDGEDEIYAIEFSPFQVLTTAKGWEDKEYLHFPREDIVKVEMPSFTILEKDALFFVDGLSPDQETNKNQMDILLSKMTDLFYKEVLGNEDPSLLRADKPELVYTVQLISGSRTYTFWKMNKGEDFILKSSNADFYFKMSNAAVTSLNIKRKDLSQKKELPK